MFPKRFSVCALVAALALLVVGCSNGGGKHASPTTTIATTSSTAVTTTTTVLPSHVVANPCPSKLPTASQKVLNARVAGLGTKLVPFAALMVRICDYSPFSSEGGVGNAVVSGSKATALEEVTNSLRPWVPTVGGRGPCGGFPQVASPTLFVTFANDSQRVTITSGDDRCPRPVTNGTSIRTPTQGWVNKMVNSLGGVIGG
jgi:hypothetical protein